MRKVGKAKTTKFLKQVTTFLKELGAIEMTNKPSNGETIYYGESALGFTRTEPNAFIMETICGLLWLHVCTDPESRIFSVFARFDNVKKAVEFFGKDHLRLNQYSGKFNFHYSELEDMMAFLRFDLVQLVPTDRKVITTFEELEELGEDTTDAKSIMLVHEGAVHKNSRVCIDNAKLWKDEFKNWRGKKMVMVDACACLISKSTDFQLIIDGEMTTPK